MLLMQVVVLTQLEVTLKRGDVRLCPEVPFTSLNRLLPYFLCGSLGVGARVVWVVTRGEGLDWVSPWWRKTYLFKILFTEKMGCVSYFPIPLPLCYHWEVPQCSLPQCRWLPCLPLILGEVNVDSGPTLSSKMSHLSEFVTGFLIFPFLFESHFSNISSISLYFACTLFVADCTVFRTINWWTVTSNSFYYPQPLYILARVISFLPAIYLI